ncbi:Splicing factor U2AF 35 kDa subunit [Sciurus carolinensis]|uniref:Splicing factor U2AF 35 kDa subunit n=1 Tax=Sciurus carolinensis TaxID=30640 RepID=A0AA41MGC1_SCICA|nr:Splicing factor U2AF 35 kDa subunit [Sciurus carolinensis]
MDSKGLGVANPAAHLRAVQEAGGLALSTEPPKFLLLLHVEPPMPMYSGRGAGLSLSIRMLLILSKEVDGVGSRVGGGGWEMAEYLASIFGTEKDKVNCSFYFKIGACRHGDRCSRLHNKPTFSQTIALLNIYRNPQNSSQSADGLRCAVSDVEMQEHYDEFFEEVFTEMEEKYGEVEEMNVCDNLGDHLVGNVYVKFRREEDAEKAVIDLNNRWFNGQPIHAELSPVTDFREACCRQYEMGECTRGGFCNFMHLKPISRELRRELYGRRRKK